MAIPGSAWWCFGSPAGGKWYRCPVPELTAAGLDSDAIRAARGLLGTGMDPAAILRAFQEDVPPGDNLSEEMRDRRAELGMTLEAVGKVLGCSRGSVWNIENGLGGGSELLARAAAWCGCEVSQNTC